jgi:hypothetical protein
MEESEMVDRVARAMMARGAPENWEGWQNLARAGIEEMYEPTSRMFMCGANAEPYNRAETARMRGRRIGDKPARDCWKIMIATALDRRGF